VQPGGRTALIVGAGIGGLAAALALTRAGWRVRVFERSAAPRELGFGLMLAPNAMAALDELGVGPLVRTRGYTPRSVEIRTADGRLLRAFRTPPGGPSEHLFPVIALRPAVFGTLFDALPSEVVIPAGEAIGFEETSDGLVLRLADGRVVSGDVLVGADGIGSTVRKALHPGDPPPVPSAYCGLRGVVFDAQRFMVGLDALAMFGPGLEAAAVRASDDAIYWYASMLADEVSADASPLQIRQQRLAGVDPAFHAIVTATAEGDLRFDRFVERPPFRDWGRGRVTLLGDAAHPVLPHTGQGAAQALEDAVALGLSLSAERNVTQALRRYERIRARRTHAIVKSGSRIAGMTTTRSALVSRTRNTLLRVIPASAFALPLRAQARDPHRTLRSAGS
jgi:2-polyprenyl-6-methoxyphenol hydroxylase-like FAD-dependent oxidoreductase